MFQPSELKTEGSGYLASETEAAAALDDGIWAAGKLCRSAWMHLSKQTSLQPDIRVNVCVCVCLSVSVCVCV